MNIILTGFMGTGKTTVGRRVAESLSRKFIDVDAEIERSENRTVRDIFERAGEAAFRQIEAAAIERLSQQDGLVISAGGGAMLNPKNRENFARNGVLICLRARTSTILERLKEDIARPLLAGENRVQKIEQLMKERQSVYDLCPLQIETDSKTISDVAAEIIRKVTAS